MKKYIIYIALFVFAGLAALLCIRLFCNSGRYQIAFGNIQSEYVVCGEDRREGKQIAPVCIKIDTFTGECWIYQDNWTVWATGETTGEKGFLKIPKYKLELPELSASK